LFKTFLGSVPSKYQTWPLPGMSSQATLPPSKSLQMADPDSLRIASLKQSSAQKGYGSGRGSTWGLNDPHLSEQERFMRWKAGAYNTSEEERSQHALHQDPGDHSWLGRGKGKTHVQASPPMGCLGQHCQEQLASLARGTRSLPPPPCNPRLTPDRGVGGSSSGSGTPVEPAHNFITSSTGVFCRKCGITGPDFNPCSFT